MSANLEKTDNQNDATSEKEIISSYMEQLLKLLEVEKTEKSIMMRTHMIIISGIITVILLLEKAIFQFVGKAQWADILLILSLSIIQSILAYCILIINKMTIEKLLAIKLASINLYHEYIKLARVTIYKTNLLHQPRIATNSHVIASIFYKDQSQNNEKESNEKADYVEINKFHSLFICFFLASSGMVIMNIIYLIIKEFNLINETCASRLWLVIILTLIMTVGLLIRLISYQTKEKESGIKRAKEKEAELKKID